MNADQLARELERRMADVERAVVPSAGETGAPEALTAMLKLRRDSEMAKGGPERTFALLKLALKAPGPSAPAPLG